ncbi:MAG: hypothetical protein NTW59_04135 [Candidatus Diapherotrites archaeon]|nr:hypothetical protein [Candidatus Diapherotrites archaeon]
MLRKILFAGETGMRIVSKILLQPKQLRPSYRCLKVEGVFNPAAVRLPGKKILLMGRVAESSLPLNGTLRCPVIAHDNGYKVRNDRISAAEIRRKVGNSVYLRDGTCRLTTISHLKKILLDKSGFEVEKIPQQPAFTGTPSEGQFGVEDPHITKLRGEFAMTYVGVSLHEGISTCLALSGDLSRWHRQGIIFREQNKDVVLFPEKINGRFVALHRPEGNFRFSKPAIWISHSPDLVYWGREKTIICPREKSWESDRIGAGTVPIKTKEGWLEIYHGVRRIGNRRIYSAGAVLLDRNNPEKVIARSPPHDPLLHPSAEYEKKGFVDHVVFPSGALMDLNGKDLLLFCGGADKVISIKKIPIKDIFNHMNHY